MKILKELLPGVLFFYLPFHAGAYLTTKARKTIRQILGTECIAMAANWADFIKSEPSYSYLSPWHYIDFKDNLSYPELQQYLEIDTVTDAYTRKTRAAIRSKCNGSMNLPTCIVSGMRS